MKFFFEHPAETAAIIFFAVIINCVCSTLFTPILYSYFN